jgi:outer membrane lipoprotein LolB
VLRRKAQLIFATFLVLWVSACSLVPVEPDVHYARAGRDHLYDLQQWSFEGRLALTGQHDSWSANISWDHNPGVEKIKLSGPLGQGTVLIQLAGHVVTVDHGDGKVESSAEAEQFINQQLGMFVPLRSLRYWVVGLPEPAKAFEETPAGFKQAGWLSEFKQMQRTNNEAMPRKMTVTNEQVKVKLIIDHWMLNDAKTN